MRLAILGRRKTGVRSHLLVKGLLSQALNRNGKPRYDQSRPLLGFAGSCPARQHSLLPGGRSLWEVVAAVGHGAPDDSAEFDGHRRDGREVVEALAFAVQVVVAQVAFAEAGTAGHQPQGVPQVRRGRPQEMKTGD